MPGSMCVVVTEKMVGYSERTILDPTARFGDWHTYSRIFAAGDETFTDASVSDRLVQITPKTLSAIAELMDALSVSRPPMWPFASNHDCWIESYRIPISVSRSGR